MIEAAPRSLHRQDMEPGRRDPLVSARVLARDELGELERVGEVEPCGRSFAAARAESTLRRFSSRWKIAYGWPCEVDAPPPSGPGGRLTNLSGADAGVAKSLHLGQADGAPASAP